MRAYTIFLIIISPFAAWGLYVWFLLAFPWFVAWLGTWV